MPGSHRGTAADELAEVFARSDEDVPTRVAIRKGLIIARDYPTRTCTVRIDGVTDIPNVPFLHHYFPVVNDIVALQRWGTSLLVIGALNRTEWINYTPGWTSNSGTPSLGNGTFLGRYHREGPDVHFRVQLTIGSTTTFGDPGNAWSFGLPVQPHSSMQHACAGHCFDSLAGAIYSVNWEIRAGNTALFAGWGHNSTGAAIVVGNGQPFAPTTGNQYFVSGTYEAGV
jgi:hypothetical protein